MKFLNLVPALLLVFATLNINAQDLLEGVPQTEEEFKESEDQVLATIEWLETTPIYEQEEKHKKQYALFLMWITNSPTVSIEIHENILIFTKKNPELLFFFMAGWTKYCLENDYSDDKVQGNLGGLRSAIKIYSMGDMKKDKKMLKLIELDKNGELEAWVVEQLK